MRRLQVEAERRIGEGRAYVSTLSGEQKRVAKGFGEDAPLENGAEVDRAEGLYERSKRQVSGCE